ncbi:unnamed protein product [Closterium sp. Naga37s-1]|nr:unnamed protein product [Closterium sp. Naga37s-1]
MVSLSPVHYAIRQPCRLLRHESRTIVSNAPRQHSNLGLSLSPLTSIGPSPSFPHEYSRISSRRDSRVVSSNESPPRIASQRSPKNRDSSLRVRAAAERGAKTAQQSDSAARESVDVLIAGAGVAGLATALALHRVGIDVAVVERAPGLGQSGTALSLWGNAWRALDALGVAALLRTDYVRLEGVDIAAADGTALRSFDFADCNVGPDHEVRGVTRAHLLSCMASQLPPGTIRFATTISHIPEPTATATASPMAVTLSNGATIEAKTLIGVVSLMPIALLSTPLLTSTILPLIPLFTPGPIRFPFPPPHSHFPIRTSPFALPHSRSPLALPPSGSAAAKEEALSYVQGWQGGIERLIHATPATSIVVGTITDRWTMPPPLGTWGRGAVTLAGDAAHPMTPNLGQGACTALEDAVILARCLWEASEPDERHGKGSGGVEEGEDGASVRRRRVESEKVCGALREYERLRGRRVAQLTVRSFGIGWLLQLPQEAVCFARDKVVLPHLFSPSHFLDHALFDCGKLPDSDAS